MNYNDLTRRDFLTTSASGIGALALNSIASEGLAAGVTHFPAKAKNCICIFMAGAPSSIDLFDPKPTLNKLNGKALPPKLLKGKRFAFIQPGSAVLMGSVRKYSQHGNSGMWFSDLLPNIAKHSDDICMINSMHTDQFNHHPGQLLMQTGSAQLGHASMGSWLNYGLGSENKNLPGYMVLTSGRGSSGGTTLWQSGYLPSTYGGVRLRSSGTPILNLKNPSGIDSNIQRKSLDTIGELNKLNLQKFNDPETNSRIKNYELAYRMQTAAPELMDISKEKESIKEMYGLGRKDPKIKSHRGGGPGQFDKFAKNCLLARRMVERGVRFVNLIHASWDHHSNLNVELGFNSKMADQPIAALLADLKQRGLLDETLVIWMAEFGRTPLGENRRGRAANTGRDHHPDAYSIWMAGGGVKKGLTYGKTDELGWGIVENPVHANDFHATVLRLFGLDHEKLTYNYKGIPQRLSQITRHSKVIKGLIG